MSSSVYVHSNADNVNNWDVNIDLLSGAQGLEGDYYIESTIKKLETIRDQLNDLADDFLRGYSVDFAQNTCERVSDLLVQLAGEALYSSSGAQLANALTLNNRVKSTELINKLQGSQSAVANLIIEQLRQNSDITVNEFATLLARTLGKGQTIIEVTEATSIIKELGGLFDISQIQTTFRKEGANLLTDHIFHAAQLTTSKSGAFRNLIKDIINSTSYTHTQSYNQAIGIFCLQLKKRMQELGPEIVPFIYGPSSGGKPLDPYIDNFIDNLKPILRDALNELYISGKMKDKSNVRGSIGEEVRTSILKAANSVTVSITVGTEKEDDLVQKVNQMLQEMGHDSSITKMMTHHLDGKQSLTDLILINTKTGQVARAQSKSYLASYFTKDTTDPIGGFRWMIAKDLEVLTFLKGLSLSEAGMNLNDFDFSTLSEAMANNLWFKYHGSVVSHDPNGFEIDKVSVEDFQKELEGTLEKLLAGQVINLLGVNIAKQGEKIDVISGASNIFYLLNGRIKRTADLIQQAIDQLRESANLKLTQGSRLVIVNLNTTGARNVKVGSKSNSFLVHKLRPTEFGYTSATAVGEEKGQEILENITINVSLGTSIDSIRKTSFMFG